jgi:hypothetical protein
MGQRTVILLSPQFAPSPLAGTHRARHMAKHLPTFGWRPIIVAAREDAYTETPDRALCDLIPNSVEQVRTGALDARLTRRFGIGDIGLRGYRHFSRAIDELVARESPAVVFITGAPYYPMLLARRIKRVHRLPVVLDFQDPWVSAFGASQPPWSKAGISHRLGVGLERRAVEAAAFVTGVSEIQNRELAERYPWFDARAMEAIPIGADPEDFERVQTPSLEAAGDGKVELRYIGAYWPKAEPGVRQLMRGVAALRAASPALAQKMRLHFIGTWSGEVPGVEPPRPVEALAAEEGVGELVRESPRRVPFVEALRLMSTAHGLILVGSDEPHYTASKIYPALMSGRRYLSLFHARSSAHAVLTRAGGGRALGFETPDDLAALTPAIAEGLATLASKPQALGTIDREAYAPYTAQAVAGRFAAIFERLVGDPT